MDSQSVIQKMIYLALHLIVLELTPWQKFLGSWSFLLSRKMDALLKVRFPPTVIETQRPSSKMYTLWTRKTIPYIYTWSVHISPDSTHTSVLPHLWKIFYSLFGVNAESFLFFYFRKTRAWIVNVTHYSKR